MTAKRVTERERRSKEASRIKARRQRLHGLWDKMRNVIAVVLALAAAAIGYTVWTGAASRAVAEVVDKGYRSLASIGFSVDHMTLDGRTRTTMAEVKAAIGFDTGEPIFRVSLSELRARLEKIPTVKQAAVERALPDTLHIHLVEREPVAVWQYKGKIALIDDTGAVMRDLDMKQYKHLPLVVGEGAPEHVGDMLALLADHKDLAPQVASLVRVGNRRWDVHLKQGIRVKLPEENYLSAWQELATMQSEQQILLRDIQTIDLRDGERMYITLAPRELAPANLLPTKDT
jgi:cell division protein FtsQ